MFEYYGKRCGNTQKVYVLSGKKSYSRKGHYSQTWKVRFLTGFKKKEYSPSSYNFPNKITSRIKI